MNMKKKSLKTSFSVLSIKATTYTLLQGTKSCDIVISNNIYPTSCLKTHCLLRKGFKPSTRIETLEDTVYLLWRGGGGGGGGVGVRKGEVE